MSVSVSMIVRNSSDVLERCLKSVKDADEIVIVDTGSSDNTIEIAKRYTDKVYSFYGCNEPKTKDGLFMDFAMARNESLKYCTKTHIFTIDADEVLERGMDIMKNFKGESISVRCTNAKTGEVHRQPRLYIRHQQIMWKGAAHNYLTCGSGQPLDVQITYYFNQQKVSDPNRTMRILEREVRRGVKGREQYYLAKEYHRREWYRKALRMFKRYLKNSIFLAEKTDAYTLMARCYAAIGRHQDAINATLAAVNLNPDFQEALNLAGDLSGDVNRIKYQYLASKATNNGVLFIRPDRRLRVTVLSAQDWAGSGYRTVQAVRATGAKIDIEAMCKFSGQGSRHYEMRTGPSIDVVGMAQAQDRINRSDIIHYKGDKPFGREFYGLKIPKDKKIIYTVSGSEFRENNNPKDFKGDVCTYMTKDLAQKGWIYTPQPYNHFDYKWKRGKKFVIMHIPSDPIKKGSEIVVDAIKLLNRKDVDFRFHMNVNHFESVDNKQDAHIYIDQMLVPAIANSAYEAMGWGVPVVSWANGTDDLVIDPMEQTPEALAKCINEILDWTILERLSLQTFQAVQERCSTVGNQWVNIYESLK